MANLTNEGNSSFFTRKQEYDIFLSFRGEDSRNKFVSHLYEALCNKGFYTFIDSNLQRGEIVSEQIFKTIEMSKISIVVFSENYASSTWCLDELDHILKCKKDGQIVLPVFYEVEPSEVRKQEQKFGDNLSKHEEKFKDKVQNWKAALNEVGKLSGCHYNGGLETKFIQEIIEEISKFKIRGTLLFVAKYPVGVNSRAQEEESPNILRKRSRLCNYEDALQVLLGNKGSEEIRGIMLHSPTPIQVRLHPEAFKMMENLIFLMVDNVEISEELTYFPSGLRLLEWPNYPFDFPSNFGPQQLVALEMPKSCITLEMMFKQEYLYENIKSINLRHCKFIRKFPGFCAPNLEILDLSDCGNLTEIHDNIGLLDKLKKWVLYDCKKLKILPSKLNLKSLEWLTLAGCKRLKKFPQIHPEMKCLKSLNVHLGGTCIRKLPSSLRYLTSGLNALSLPEVVQNLDLSFLQYGFKSLTYLDLRHFDRNMVDLNIWLKPDYFPVLETLNLSNSNIVTIPESITKFTRLQSLLLRDCEQLQEIPRLPQSIVKLDAKNCRSLDLQSSWRLLDQFGEILGILPRSNVFFDHDCQIIIPGDKTPMWFKSNHHQSVGNSISFMVGPEIPNFGVFISFQSMKPYRYVVCHVTVLINGEKHVVEDLDNAYDFLEEAGKMCENLWFMGVSRGLCYESDPSGVNHIEVVCEVYDPMNHHYDSLSDDNTDFIKWMGIHVKCICCCRGSPIRKRRRVSPPMDLTYLGFTDGFDLGSSSMTQILDSTYGSSSVLDDTEQLPLPPVSSTSYCSDLDHGVSNS